MEVPIPVTPPWHDGTKRPQTRHGALTGAMMTQTDADLSPQLLLAGRLGDLHQMLYSRGGIRPSNAAVEELTKLLLMRIAAHRHPHLEVGGLALADLLRPAVVRRLDTPQLIKDAFALVNALPDLGGRVPGAGVQTVWPVDEPLRITRCDVLAEALEILGSIPLGGEGAVDVVGTAFDVFLRGRFEHAGGLGTYLTPDSVVRMMTKIGFELIDPFAADPEGPLMGDPCCGSGRFLVGMLEEARVRNAAIPVDLLADSVVGADQSASAVAMARVNMLAYGLSHPEVFTVEDSIVDNAIDWLRGRMRLILTNPPFGDGKYDSHEGIRRTSAAFAGIGSKERIDPSLAFVARCIELLAPQGVAGIILPDGVADGASMRQLLLDDRRLLTEVEIEGVISLPSATFAPAGTTAKTSVVFIRKGTRPSRRVFMARAEHVGHVMKKGSAAQDPDGDDLPGIAGAVVQALGGARQPGGSDVLAVDPDTLSSLDASSIDMGAVLARETLLADGGAPLSTVLAVVRKRRSAIRDDVPFISVLHLDELGNVDWQQALTYRPTTPGVLARGGQVIVSLLNPAKFRAAVIPETFDEVQISAEFGVYDSSINSYAALALLQHPLVRAQIAPMGRGTSSSRRRVDAADVLGLVGPTVDDDWVDKTGRRVHEALEAVAEARVTLISAYAGDS